MLFIFAFKIEVWTTEVKMYKKCFLQFDFHGFFHVHYTKWLGIIYLLYKNVANNGWFHVNFAEHTLVRHLYHAKENWNGEFSSIFFFIFSYFTSCNDAFACVILSNIQFKIIYASWHKGCVALPCFARSCATFNLVASPRLVALRPKQNITTPHYCQQRLDFLN